MEKRNIRLSVAIATYNEEDNIGQCLAAVSDIADEVVIVDGGSTDKTVEIVRHYKANIIQTDNPPVFHINKQKAVDACHGEWILQLDADEVVPDDLRKEIEDTIGRNPKESGFYLPRKNYFLGHWFRKGGQYPDYVIRLMRRGKGKFPSKSVHEQIAVDGAVGYFTHPLLHYSVRTIAEYWKKADAYTSLTADEFVRLGLPKTIASYLRYEIVKPLETFFSLYLRHKGFLDGVYGFLFAFFSAFHLSLIHI